MGHIKEPRGIDFFVENKPITERDKKLISEIISQYKATGHKKLIPNKTKRFSGKKKHLAHL